MKKTQRIFCLLCICGLLAGCAGDMGIRADRPAQTADEKTENTDTGFQVMGPGVYDSADTAVIVDVEPEEQKITLRNLVVNKNYTLNYDGTTTIYDKYGGALSVAQLQKGDIVDVTFRKIPKKCIGIRQSDKAWENSEVKDFAVSQARGQISFGGSQYALYERLMLLSGEETIELMDLNECDVLDVQGMDNTVYSIRVEKGHGYLRLENAEYFIGGWIEVGGKVIRKITEDMLLVVPEGSYQMLVNNGRHGGIKDVTIHRDEETLVDVGDLKGEEVKMGNVFFTVTPSDASIYIDGEKVDTASYVSLEYGIHQMIVRAAGYETITQYIRVGQENANLNVEMEPEGSSLDKSDSGNEESVSGNDYSAYDELPLEGTPGTGAESGQASTVQSQAGSSSQAEEANRSYYVKVNAPINVEVYVDGNYVGIAPVKFAKKEGSHVISLRKTGYQTRSYTIQVDNEKKDMELSFSNLVQTTLPSSDLGSLAIW